MLRILVVAIIFGCAGCAKKDDTDSRLVQLSERVSRMEAAQAGSIEKQAAQPLASLSATIVELSAESQKSVVQVIADPSVVTNSGAGFIYNRDGIILTNDHLVKVTVRHPDGEVKTYYKDKITVKLHDGRSVVGELIGVDPGTDLAAIKIEIDRLPPPLTLATRRVQQGEMAYSIGHPRGLDYSVEWRPVSAPYRIGSLNDTLVHQIDRGFFVGNSGGPVLDLEGKVIGMVYSSFTLRLDKDSNTEVLYAPIGWAIPAEAIARVAPELIDGKYRVTGFIRK
ncbi:MAG: serine protease [Methylococcaceae bacterium]|nr:serine protease [Methylococcaceae bacterium]MCI0733007.1 serine protease [Methylococcaceae bacterium]